MVLQATKVPSRDFSQVSHTSVGPIPRNSGATFAANAERDSSKSEHPFRARPGRGEECGFRASSGERAQDIRRNRKDTCAGGPKPANTTKYTDCRIYSGAA